MDEIDVKSALRRYVTGGAPPPFPLGAKDLVAKGRQRQLLRVGIGCLSSGTMVIITAIVASAALTGPPGQVYPGVEVRDCERPLPVAVFPSPERTPLPSYDPSPAVIASTAVHVEPTGQSVEPTRHPTAQLAGDAIGTPTQFPSGSVPEVTRWPSVPPVGPLPQDADPAKLAAMRCYVKGAALILFPNSSFAPASEPPMELVRWPDLDETIGWHPTYGVRTQVVDGVQIRYFMVRVRPVLPVSPRPRLEVRKIGNGRTAYIDQPYAGIVEVTTEHTSIVVWADGGLLTEAQAIGLATAPELDVFG